MASVEVVRYLSCFSKVFIRPERRAQLRRGKSMLTKRRCRFSRAFGFFGRPERIQLTIEDPVALITCNNCADGN
jgi:hypothetical protein